MVLSQMCIQSIHRKQRSGSKKKKKKYQHSLIQMQSYFSLIKQIVPTINSDWMSCIKIWAKMAINTHQICDVILMKL